MKECINIGLIGYGQRGTYLLRDTLLHRTDIHILAVCDAYEDRVIAEEKGYTPLPILTIPCTALSLGAATQPAPPATPLIGT